MSVETIAVSKTTKYDMSKAVNQWMCDHPLKEKKWEFLRMTDMGPMVTVQYNVT